MNVNPFDILKNAGDLQRRFAEMQTNLEATKVTGSSGGGMVTVIINGKMEVQTVKLAPECVDPQEIPLLEDLIRAALNDAQGKLKETMQSQIGTLAGLGGMGGFGIPSA